MEDLFKKFLYTGVGLVSSTAEKFQTNVSEWLDVTKETEAEGKKLVEDLMKDTDAKRQEMEDRVRTAFDKALSRFNVPTQEEINALKSKVAELEAALAVSKTAEVVEVQTTVEPIAETPAKMTKTSRK